MAPGIRLFRRIGFPAKSAWVSVAFLLPILLLATSLWISASVAIEFSAKERLGVQYARALMPLLDAAQNQRRAATANAADLPAAQQKVAQALEAVAALQQRLGAELATGTEWTQVQRLHGELASQPVRADADATFGAHTAFVDAALALLNQVADGSNLTLDPDVDTYYLMDAALFKTPQLIEQIGKLRGLGNAILGSGQKSPAQHDLLTEANAFAMAHQAGADAALKRAVAADSTIASELDVKGGNTASAEFLQRVKQQILGAELQGEAPAYLAAANEAIALQYRSVSALFDALDKRLAARVDRLTQTLWLQLAISLFSVAAAIYLLVAFYRVTQGGIKEVARQLEHIARGDLTLYPKPWGRDEVAQLMNTLAATLDSLRAPAPRIFGCSSRLPQARPMPGSSFGELFRVTNFGESHGPAIGCVIDGCPPGLELSEADIQPELDRRRPGTSRHVTQRNEPDAVEILSGVFEGRSTGTPIALLIRNTDQRSKDYGNLLDTFRPGHADYTYWRKYGERDPRGGGRSSARLTAPMVAAGAVAKKWLRQQHGTTSSAG
jgi:hypothetical protein